MHWKTPPIIKIYEAIGSLADDRIEIFQEGDLYKAKVFSSSGNKFYEVDFDEKNNAIMLNDNGSYWQGYLGYPGIALLLNIGIIKLEEKYIEPLKDIKWKDINVKNNNDFEKTISEIDKILEEKGVKLEEFRNYLDNLIFQIEKLNLGYLGEKKLPPKGY